MKSKPNKEPFGTNFSTVNNNTISYPREWRIDTKRGAWLSIPEVGFRVRFSSVEFVHDSGKNIVLMLSYKIPVIIYSGSYNDFSLERKTAIIYLTKEDYIRFRETLSACFVSK